MLFSIIIPAYNVAEYIEQCVLSIAKQSFPADDYEIIVVNDCSTDQTASVLERMQSEISNLIILDHKENKRQGGARNTGIKASKGKYLFFVDGDDCWLCNNVLSVYCAYILSDCPTIIRSQSYKSVADNKRTCSHAECNCTVITQTTGENIIADHRFFYNIWTSCYSKNHLVKNDIWFREHVAFEDSDWSTRVVLKAPKVMVVDFPFYGYRTNMGSTTNLPKISTFKDNIQSLYFLWEIQKNDCMSTQGKSGCLMRIKKSILSYIRISRNYKLSESMKVLNILRRSDLMRMQWYQFTLVEWFEFVLLKYFPIGLLASIRYITLIKRLVHRTKL